MTMKVSGRCRAMRMMPSINHSSERAACRRRRLAGGAVLRRL